MTGLIIVQCRQKSHELTDSRLMKRLKRFVARHSSRNPNTFGAFNARVATVIIRKTKNASPAFIKELMRRSAQYHIQGRHNGSLKLEHVESALDEMLFSGGSLNVKLLGGAGQDE